MEDISVKDIGRITDALKSSQGVDFSDYAFSSYRRRIIRFTEINRIRNIDLLTSRIAEDQSFADSFIEAITVNVTEMFRDPGFWVMLREKVLPALASRSEINIWHAACSTGEEVYSMAILLREAGLLEKTRIVATDINRNVLKTAASGKFRLRNQEVNGRNYSQMQGKTSLADFYTIEDGLAVFDASLVRSAEFMHHDLAKDGAFSLFDLVLCRNVMIYFNSELQERVLSVINKSMNMGAFLAIGSKESIRWCRDYNCFSEVSMEEKIYRKISERRDKHFQN